MSIHRRKVSIAASATYTINFGNVPYANVSFHVESGTGSGTIRVFTKAVGATSFNEPNPNRIVLAATPSPYKLIDLPLQAIKLVSSGTAANAMIIFNAWEKLGK